MLYMRVTLTVWLQLLCQGMVLMAVPISVGENGERNWPRHARHRRERDEKGRIVVAIAAVMSWFTLAGRVKCPSRK